MASGYMRGHRFAGALRSGPRLVQGIQRWQVFGGSWAVRWRWHMPNPSRPGNRARPARRPHAPGLEALDWFYNGPAGLIRPEWWSGFTTPLGVDARSPLDVGTPGNDNISRYHQLLVDPDPAVQVPADIAWTAWENASVKLVADPGSSPRRRTPRPPSPPRASRTTTSPMPASSGRTSCSRTSARSATSRRSSSTGYDMCCPVRAAYDLSAVWPEAELSVVLAGRAATEPAIVAATDRFAR